MYTIIGGDGKEYGPVTAEQVRVWLSAGRVNLDTQGKALGTNEWKRLGDYPAFSGRGDEPPLTAAIPADEQNLAGRGARLGARLIDWLLVAFCLWPLMKAVYTSVYSHGRYSFTFSDAMNIPQSGKITSGVWMFLILVLVQVLLVSIRGQSIGKLLFRIRIVRSRRGQNAGFFHAVFLRGFLPFLIELIPLVSVPFFLVDTCLIFRGDRRCLHDLIADTVVINAARAPGA